jgi:RNA polymerase sigma factor (sigma-70 family)
LTSARRRALSEYDDSVRLYLDEIGRYPLLTKDEEVRLAREIEAGRAARAELAAATSDMTAADRRRLRRAVRDGEGAWEMFVQSNLRLVVMVAKRYQASGLPLLDLVQEGNLGLMHAVDKFDWRKGFKFSTYATWWIRQAVQRGVANSARVIRLPVQADAELTRLRAARAEADELGTTPTTEALAAAAALSPARVEELLPFLADPLALQMGVGEDAETELGDLVRDQTVEAPDAAVMGSLLPSELHRVLDAVPPRDRSILVFRYGLDGGDPRTVAETAALVGLSGEQVRRIEVRALGRLRDLSTDLELRELLAA